MASPFLITKDQQEQDQPAVAQPTPAAAPAQKKSLFEVSDSDVPPVKKKDGSLDGGVPSAPTPSQSGSQSQSTTQTNPYNEIKGSIIDRLAQQAGYNAPIGASSTEGTSTMLNQKVKGQLQAEGSAQAKNINEFARNPNTRTFNKVAKNIDKTDVLADKNGKLVKQAQDEKKAQLSNKFYDANLDETDINDIVQSNPFLRNQQINNTLLTNTQIAQAVNQKTKDVADAAKVINVNAYNYAFNVKDINNQVYKTQRNLDIASEANDGTVWVDPATTTLKPVGSEVGGLVPVNSADFLKEQQTNMEDLTRRKDFIEQDFTRNVYDPHVQKVTADIIRQIENDKGKSAQDLDPSYLAKETDKRVRALKDPILMAKNGVDVNDEKPLFNSFSEGSAFSNGGNDDYVIVADKTGQNHSFKNGDNLDVYNQVASYFNVQKPIHTAAQKEVDKLVEQPQYKKFAPLVESQQQINDYFSSTAFKNNEANIKSVTDASSQFINQEWKQKLADNPAYQNLVAQAKEAVEKGTKTQDEATEWLNSTVNTDSQFKSLNEGRNAKLAVLVKQSDNMRMNYILNGIKGLNPNLTVNSDGSIGVKGATAEESAKFKQKLASTYKDAASSFIDSRERGEAAVANAVVNSYSSLVGSTPTAFGLGVRAGTNNMMESFARYYDFKDLRNYYTGVASNDVLAKSELVKNASEFQGLSSLVNPAYYAYNTGQSVPFMAPALAAGLATGGTGAGMVIGGFVAGNLETVQDGWDRYNTVLKEGRNADGIPVTQNEAARAAAEDMSNEFIPNIVISNLEFGALARGLKPEVETLKRTIGGEVRGAAKNLLETGLEEGLQEGVQGGIQKNAENLALGKQTYDVLDYLQDDDFRQNFWGGFAGGVGFGVAGAGKRIANAPAVHENWLKIAQAAKDNVVGFNDTVLKSYAIGQEMDGSGAQFRDGIKLRLSNNDYKDEAEKTELMNTLAYSAGLKNNIQTLGIAAGNINGIAAAHYMALADQAGAIAKRNEGTAVGNVFRKKANEYQAQAGAILEGNSKANQYMLTKEGTPIFVSEQDAKVLSESGEINKMLKEGTIASTNIEYDDKVSDVSNEATQQQPTTTETTNADVVNKTESVQAAPEETTAVDKDALIKQAQDAAGDINEIYRQGFIDDTEDSLRQVAEQLNSSESEASTTRKVFGDAIADIALKLFPDAKVGEQVNVMSEVNDEEYKNFIDKGEVTDERLNDIAQKVKDQTKLSDRENEIFTDKTSEINKILQNENQSNNQENGSQSTEQTSQSSEGNEVQQEGILADGAEAPIAEPSPRSLTGLSDEELDNRIGKRAKVTALSERQSAINDLVDKATKFREMSKRDRVKPEGVRLRDEIRQGIKPLGLKFNGEYILDDKNKKLSAKYTDVGHKAITNEKGATLGEKSPRVQQVFKKIYADDITPTDVDGISGQSMSHAQINAAMDDVADGINSVGAKQFLDALERMVDGNVISFKDENTAGTVQTVPLDEVMGGESLVSNMPVSEGALMDWLKGDASNDYFEDPEIRQSFEDILNEYENEQTTNGEDIQQSEPNTEGSSSEQTKQADSKQTKEQESATEPSAEEQPDKSGGGIKEETEPTESPEEGEPDNSKTTNQQPIDDTEAQAEVEQWLADLKEGKKVSQTAISLLPRILDNPALRKAINSSFIYYVPETQADARSYAQGVVDFLGADGTIEYIQKEQGAIPPMYHTAMLVSAAEKYAQDMDTQGEVRAITMLREHGTVSAQGLQSMKAAYEWFGLTNSVEAQKMFVRQVANNINSSVDQLPEVQQLLKTVEEIKDELGKSLSENEQLKSELEKALKDAITATEQSESKTPKEKTEKKKAKDVSDAIKKLKIKTDPNSLYSNPFGAFVPLVNAAIDIVANLVEGGMNIVDAIEKGIEHIKSQNDKFKQEDDFRKFVSENIKIPTSDAINSDYVLNSITGLIDDVLYNSGDYEGAVNKQFFYLSDKAREKVSSIIGKHVKAILKEKADSVKKDLKEAKNSTLVEGLDLVASNINNLNQKNLDNVLKTVGLKNGLKYITSSQLATIGKQLQQASTLKGFQKAEAIERVSNFLEQQDDKFTSAFLTSTMYLKNLFSYSFALQSVISNRLQLGVGFVSNTIEDVIKNGKFDSTYFKLLFDKNVRRGSVSMAADIISRGGVPMQNMMHLLQPLGQSIPKSRLEEYKIVQKNWAKKVFNKAAQFVGAGANRLASVTDTPITYRLAKLNLYQSVKDSIRKNQPNLSEKDVEKAAWAAMNATDLNDARTQADSEFANRGYTVTGDHGKFQYTPAKVQGIKKAEQQKSIDRRSTIYRRRVGEIMDEKVNEQYAKELENSVNIASNLLFKENVGDTFQKQTPIYKRITNGVGGLVTSTVNGIMGMVNNLVGDNKVGTVLKEGASLTFAGYINAAGNIMEKVLESDPRYATAKIVALALSKKGLTKEEKAYVTKRQIQTATNSIISAVVMGAVFAISKAWCGQNVKITKSSKVDGNTQNGNMVICGHEIPMKYFPIHARMLEMYGAAMNDPEISEEDKQSIFTGAWHALTHIGWDFFETDPAQYESNITKTINTFAGGDKKLNVGPEKDKAISGEQSQNYWQRMLAGYGLNYVPLPTTFIKQTSNGVNALKNEGTRYFTPTGEINSNSFLNFMNGFAQQVGNQTGYQSIMNTFGSQGKPYLDYRGRVVDNKYAEKRDAIDQFMGKYESRVNMYSQTYSPIFDKDHYRTMTDKEHVGFYTEAVKNTNDWLEANYPQKSAMYKTYVDKYGKKYTEEGKTLKTEDEYFLMKFTGAQTKIKKAVIQEQFGKEAVQNK